MPHGDQTSSSTVGAMNRHTAARLFMLLAAYVLASPVYAQPARTTSKPAAADAAEITSGVGRTVDPSLQRTLTAKDVTLHPLKRLFGIDLYPERAQRLRVAGSVVIACVVSAEQRLTDCKTIYENPGGMDFAESTLRIYSNFEVDRLAKNGAPTVGQVVTLTMKFKPK